MELSENQRLPFGVTSAPAFLQSFMDEVLKGVPNVACYIVDIIVSGKNNAVRQKPLEPVLI